MSANRGDDAVAKKSSSNAVKKLDEQIKKLTELDDRIEKKEVTTVIDKKRLEKELKENGPKKSSTTKKNTTSKTNNTNKTNKTKNNSKNSGSKIGSNGETTKKSTTNSSKSKTNNTKPKSNIKKTTETTVKIKKLENEIRDLYDREDDLGKTREFSKISDVISSKAVKVEKELNKKIENVSDSFLNKLLLIVFAIFMVFFIIFVGFIIFISTF